MAALEAASVRFWLGGGWGVDALVGRTTREHRDLDLAVDADAFDVACETLLALGFVAETDWLPVRLEVAGGPGGWVDLHPVVFDAHGNGTQAGLDGEVFLSRRGPCISAGLQRVFHSGYDPRPQDLHDLRVLEGVYS